MNRPILKTLVIIITIAVMLTVGCGPQEPPSVKKSRTIAAENIELRKQLAQSSKEIDEQKKLLQTCLQSTGRLTAEKDALKKKSQQNIRSQVKGVLDTVLEENKKLREQNARLKAQIEELQKQPQ